jgi:predicted RNase H-like HicB family nuclease
MRILRPKNTKKGGIVEFFAYKDGYKYTGVCLTFDIIEEGSNIREVMENVKNAALLHLKAVIENNLPDDLLNRYAPKEYWDKYESFVELITKKKLYQKKLAEASQLLYNPQFIRDKELCFA